MPAAIDYPSALLPLPLISGYQNQDKDPNIRTEMDSGYVVVRNRFTSTFLIAQVELLLTQDEISFFEQWFSSTLNKGVSWFNMDLAVGASLTASHECRIQNQPQAQLVGINWRVSFTIEAIARDLGPTYDSTLQGLIISLGGFEKASEYFNKLDTAINITYPSSGYGPNA